MSSRAVFAAVGLLAAAAGTALWMASRPPAPPTEQPSISSAALYAASFADAAGRPQSLGQFQGKLLVINFWATWCGPCRKEMPAFSQAHRRWKDRGVAMVGLSADEPAKVEAFARELGVDYPLWTGGSDVAELSKRLGNRLAVLPHTVLVSPAGEILESRVGPYSEADLEQRFSAFAPKRQ